MKYRFFRISLLAALILLIIAAIVPMRENTDAMAFTLPVLPRPIAKTPVAIISAGQNTDTYIIRDIANQLMIRSFFMPQARDIDIEDMNSLVFVVGYSSLGEKLQEISHEEEKDRIVKLLQKADEKKLVVLTVALGEEYNHDEKTKELLKLIGEHTDYLIGIKGSINEGTLVNIAKEREIPLTLAGDVKEISGPFASAFR
jgi:hypothetical protein